MAKPRKPVRKAPYPASGGPGSGVFESPEGFGDEEEGGGDTLDPERFAEELAAELEIACGNDLEGFIRSRLSTAIKARMVANEAGHYNTAKNWEIIVHRLRKELDRCREDLRKQQELAGASAEIDPLTLARRILANLPALVAVAPDAAEQAWRVLGAKLGKS